MSSLHFQKDNSNKGNNKGFYIALGVCLIAIGVAAWTTYDSVVKYANPTEEETSSSQAAEPTQQTVSGVTAGPVSQPKAPTSSKAEEVKAPENTKPQESTPPVESQPPAKPAQTEPDVEETIVPPTSAAYSFPVGNKVTKNFSGENPIYSDTMQDWRVHSGTDFSAKNGDAVAAIASGVVTDSYQDGLLGNVLVIEHDGGVTAYYCGLGDTLLVKKGDSVTAGQKIGSVTTIPCESTEVPHLHLEIKKDGEYIDPLSILE